MRPLLRESNPRLELKFEFGLDLVELVVVAVLANLCLEAISKKRGDGYSDDEGGLLAVEDVLRGQRIVRHTVSHSAIYDSHIAI